MRQPYQTLIIPYKKEGDKIIYAIFKRKDFGIWQFVSGGGEDNETKIQTAIREVKEEIKIDLVFTSIKPLSSITTIPAEFIGGFQWGENVLVVPEYSFAFEVKGQDIQIGIEHTEYQWLPYKEAREKLKYDSNKSALWELNYRLLNKIN